MSKKFLTICFVTFVKIIATANFNKGAPAINLQNSQLATDSLSQGCG